MLYSSATLLSQRFKQSCQPNDSADEASTANADDSRYVAHFTANQAVELIADHRYWGFGERSSWKADVSEHSDHGLKQCSRSVDWTDMTRNHDRPLSLETKVV